MTDTDRKLFRMLRGASRGGEATADDLQGLLLQVSLALLMVFMIAYFIFVGASRRTQQEQVMELNRQKLELALEKTAEDARVRYGLNALMTQGTDGGRVFDADAYIVAGRLQLAPAAKTAFAQGSRNAVADYADYSGLLSRWREAVLTASGLASTALDEGERQWLERALTQRIEDVRLDTRGVQRALAARLQRGYVEHPERLGKCDDPVELAEIIKRRSLEEVAAAIGGEMLR